MTELISGKEALAAWLNGEKVERHTGTEWVDFDAEKWAVYHIVKDNFRFRLKPRTITLNGIEVPAPFEPKVGEEYWFIADYVSIGYSNTKEGTGINTSIGKWQTEAEIKQVVAALRKVFEVSHG